MSAVPAGWTKTSSHSIERGDFTITKYGMPPDVRYMAWRAKPLKGGVFTELADAIAMVDQQEKA